MFASTIEPAGKLVMAALISKCVAATAEIPVQHAPTFDELASMTGWSRSVVAEWMKALGKAGWVLRPEGTGTAKAGYQLAIGEHAVALPKRASRRKSNETGPLGGPNLYAPSRVPEQAKEQKVDALVRSADQAQSAERTNGDLVLVRSADQISPPSGPSGETSPITGVLTFTQPPSLREGSVPRQAAPSRWDAASRKPQPVADVPNKPHTPRQSSLFGKTERNLPQAAQIVLDGLKAGGYPNATADDARAVHQAVAAQYGPKVTLNYLRTMAGNRSFASFFEAIKASRAEEVEAKVRDLQRTHPDCEHDTAAGRVKHPTTGELMCPWCRTGTAKPAEVKERTHPAVAAALAAYRQASDRRLTTANLMRLTREAKALYARGCTAEQLAEYARTAARTNTGLRDAAAVQ